MYDLGVLKKLMYKYREEVDFDFNRLWAPSIYNFLTVQDIAMLHDIATSPKLSAKIDVKYDLINKIMNARGFKKFAAGTNRVVYSYLEDTSFVVKIAIDKVGLKDNPAEFYNQAYFQPFVTKCFEVSPCGTVGVFERVMPITNIEEFASMGEYIFNIIVYKILGKYVIDDIGASYFMNWGIRDGFGPCLLDYPYVYELDYEKLFCTQIDPYTGHICKGQLDYDAGFDQIVCTKCGKPYMARDLEKIKKDLGIINGGNDTMEVKAYVNGKLLAGNAKSTDFIERKESKIDEKKSTGGLKVSLQFNKVEESEEELVPVAIKVMETDSVNKNGTSYSSSVVEDAISEYNATTTKEESTIEEPVQVELKVEAEELVLEQEEQEDKEEQEEEEDEDEEENEEEDIEEDEYNLNDDYSSYEEESSNRKFKKKKSKQKFNNKDFFNDDYDEKYYSEKANIRRERKNKNLNRF